MQGIPSYWVDSAARIDVERNTVLHKTAHGELVETADWLKPGPLRVGITSGASTPDRAVEEVLSKVFKIKVRCRCSFEDWTLFVRAGFGPSCLQYVDNCLTALLLTQDPSFSGIQPRQCAPVPLPTH